MTQIILNYTPAALSANGYANDVAYSGGGYALTATTPNDGLAHEVTIFGNAATDHSAKTFTVTGTDVDGFAQTTTLAGPVGVATVTTTGYFYKTVTSVTVNATTGADTFDIGWNGIAVGPTIPMNRCAETYLATVGCDISGTINYTIQYMIDTIRDGNSPAQKSWLNHSVLAAQTADAASTITAPVTGCRFKMNSVTAGATVKFIIMEGYGS